MKKKEYQKPAIREARLNSCRIICASDVINSGSKGEEDTPEPDDNGIIWPE